MRPASIKLNPCFEQRRGLEKSGGGVLDMNQIDERVGIAQVQLRRIGPRPGQICHQLRSKDEATRVGSATVCVDCLGVMEGILAEAEQASRPAT